MFRYTFLLLVIFLGACATKPMPTARDGTLPRALEAQPVVTEFKALPGWEEQKLAEALPALLQTCRAAAKTPTWNDICAEVLLLTPDDETEIRRFFETRFVPWKMTDAGKELGLVTGYYEPSLKGSTVRSDRTPWPRREMLYRSRFRRIHFHESTQWEDFLYWRMFGRRSIPCLADTRYGYGGCSRRRDEFDGVTICRGNSRKDEDSR